MEKISDCFLCLGSNLGKREKNLARARNLLQKEGVMIVSRSSLYETEPVGVGEQPWFINQVLHVRVRHTPKHFLHLVLEIERKIGRQQKGKGEPRVIDIDILLYGETVMKTKDLSIPHPRLSQRNFVLIPLVEIGSQIVHPVKKKTMADLMRNSEDKGIVRKIN
ncbi:MAG: 2-amino-4-hydroxy-6-hydroxymethyldihydropteridine diphosphokinase [Candidatus Aminicenantes bacterium]|nr:2-amino-4-hydroxy-6-hydroxymethyldihydropteridine diphosphokinase [Candidatus Aminicenantes bacterium]